MPQEEQQLRFSIEESVWFQKGQEVSELLSISLDPDISIHEHDQYVSIRGALLLMGEYKIDEQAEEEVNFFEYGNMRYVNEIITTEDGVSLLSHRFPVDITVPREKIRNLNEVFVTIESFDYDLPEVKCLKLVADLAISGIIQEELASNREVFSIEEDAEEKAEDVIEEHDQEEKTEFILEERDQEEKAELVLEGHDREEKVEPVLEGHDQEEKAEFVLEGHDREEKTELVLEEHDREEKAEFIPAELNHEEEIELEFTRAAVEEENDKQKLPLIEEVKEQFNEEEESDDQLQSFYRDIEEEPLEEPDDDSDNKLPLSEKIEREELEQLVSSENLFFTATIEEEEESDEVFEIEVRKEPTEQIQKEQQEVQYSLLSQRDQPVKQEKALEQPREEEVSSATSDNANYLASLFARDDEEDFSKLKICIVQQGETLDMICDRYDLTVQQIIRVNDFGADNDVYEGQILYIPAYSKTK
ncbi:stage VI sporulation protein D [Metabacillus fastidiosus]|uniref:stage VI sporulation protein D n=1 Tax=Metabacillus fastidiosus TaxID=1458 RepID=UPI002E1EEABF|nr:stage VI sporulation protein D [Metabacillus fastidiosus]MED4530891.1 stage VI sporulation protein D [Metabacillus fastidiosus]